VYHRAVASIPALALSLTAALSFGLGLAACSDDAPPPIDHVDAGVDPKCAEAVDHSDLAWIQENVFSPSCADFTPCHKGRALQAQGLNLEANKSRGNLVGVPSQLFPQFDLVKPGDPDHSYLMIVLGYKPGPLPMNGTMPYNNPKLCDEKLEAIERWINNGAPETEPDAGVDAGAADAAPADAAPADAAPADAAAVDAAD